MKVITFITENNFQIDFEKVESGFYKPLIEYCGEYREIDHLLEFEEVLEIMKLFDEFDISESDLNKIDIILQKCLEFYTKI